MIGDKHTILGRTRVELPEFVSLQTFLLQSLPLHKTTPDKNIRLVSIMLIYSIQGVDLIGQKQRLLGIQQVDRVRGGGWGVCRVGGQRGGGAAGGFQLPGVAEGE